MTQGTSANARLKGVAGCRSEFFYEFLAITHDGRIINPHARRRISEPGHLATLGFQGRIGASGPMIECLVADPLYYLNEMLSQPG
jgi:hypothetical protein